MTLQDLGSIGEMIGAIGVVVTLLYLTKQIRLNTIAMEEARKLALAQMYQMRSDALQAMMVDAADSDRIGPVIIKLTELGYPEDPAALQQLSADERGYFRLWQIAQQTHWDNMRWPDDRRIESEAIGTGVRAEFVDRYENVTEDQWRNCDGVVSGIDVPSQYRAKLEKCRIFVKPAVGFDNIDLRAWLDRRSSTCCSRAIPPSIRRLHRRCPLSRSRARSISYSTRRNR